MGVTVHHFLIYGFPVVLLLVAVPLLLSSILSLPLVVLLPPLLVLALWWTWGQGQGATRLQGGQNFNAVVVGAGFSGLCAGAK